MLTTPFQLRLPRRVTAYFLLFGLTAVVWLSGSAFYVAREVNQDRSESASLRWLGRATSRAALDYLREGAKGLQPLVDQLKSQSGASYVAIRSKTGIYLAHSNHQLAGQMAVEHEGTIDEWGDAIRIQYIGPQGEKVDEYQTPLHAGGEAVGTLIYAVGQPNLWGYVRSAAHHAPLAVFGPACCMIVGAVLLNRMVRPVADIAQQLSRVAMSPSVEGCELRPVPGIGAAAMGWNRVVNERADGGRVEDLDQKIRQSLQTGRQGRLDGVLNSIPDGVATTDASGRLTYTNLPMAAILGMKDIVGATDVGHGSESAPEMTNLLVEGWQLSPNDALLSADSQHRPVVTELSRFEEGQRRVVRVARHPICIVGGAHHECHVWIIRDVTQQKLAEEMRDSFVDTATHELRTPLANIKAYAETLALADVIDVEQQKQFLNTINSEATRLARFVDDLLSVSSMEVGSLSLNRQTTELQRLLNEVLAKIKPQIEEKRLTFEVSIPEKLPEPSLDKDKIATVLVNLLGNAVKYTPAGGRVAFRVHATDQNLEIDVEDTGVGIAEDELPKVFDKFFRSDDSRVREQEGTGLGLALVQEVVRLHGGRVSVESEIDKGSTFQIVLPLG
jgi:two-component system phosphate regulon sensor histidine kinase PhoR